MYYAKKDSGPKRNHNFIVCVLKALINIIEEEVCAAYKECNSITTINIWNIYKIPFGQQQ